MFDLVIHLILIIISVCVAYPILHVTAIAFSDRYAIMANEVSIFPKGFTLESFTYILEQGKVFRAFGNSVFYTVLGVFINVAMTVIMAYPLSKTDLVGRSVLMKMILFTMFFSGGTIPTYLVVKELHLLDTVWSLVLPNAVWTMDLIVMISFYQSIPGSLYEAAYLDGASEFQIVRKVAIPLSKASIASIALFYFMGHWNSYFLPMLYLFDQKKYPLQLVLRSMLLESSGTTSGASVLAETALTPTGVKNATIVLIMIPVLLVYPFAQ
ncbi:MAG: carbohydrate ABC transporter permease [Lachnospiraceae bacterium]|nr:carbohydrate ABC transporter permease [Lachnospiraceae bacterium]